MESIIRRTHQIIDKKYNKAHQIFLITGYIRQNIPIASIDSLENISALCSSYWGSIKQQIDEIQIMMQSKSKRLSQQRRCAQITSGQIKENETNILQKRNEAKRILTEIEMERKQITQRTETVEAYLAESKPALEAAQRAVSNIDRHKVKLTPLRRERAPKTVLMTLSAVAMLTGVRCKRRKEVDTLKSNEEKRNMNMLVCGFIRITSGLFTLIIPNELIDLVIMWYPISTQYKYYSYCELKTLHKMLANRKFIPSLLRFDTNKIKTKYRRIVREQYLASEEFTFERVNKASKVCGPLVLWVRAQIKFAAELDSAEPMRKEIEEMKKRTDRKDKKCLELDGMVENLKQKIEAYKVEYQGQIRDVMRLENEIDRLSSACLSMEQAYLS